MRESSWSAAERPEAATTDCWALSKTAAATWSTTAAEAAAAESARPARSSQSGETGGDEALAVMGVLCPDVNASTTTATSAAAEAPTPII
ncbi:hypothetical protein [Kutzneria sp. 744]|uniref:hypothetical protein n=1 Tax=Kutzneria sp. (strain 744) TaxID=345341 RepID=UPI001E292618|nr:hypothetical protein [Kutzneria sp. 744]